MILHLDGLPIRVLAVNKETGESTIVFRNHTMRLPSAHLLMIIDKPTTQDEIVRLSELFYPSSNRSVGAGSGDYSDSSRASVVSTVNDSDIFAPLTVGDLYKPPKKGRGSGGNPE